MNAPYAIRVSAKTYLKLQQRSATLYARELERWNGRKPLRGSR